MPKDKRTYVTIHDGMPEHPKVEALTDRGFRVWLDLICWCSRNRTDGHVPEAVWAKRAAPKVRRELLDGGQVVPSEDGVEVHDYLEHQRSREEIEAQTADRAAAGRKGGRARAEAQAKAKQALDQVPEQTASKVQAETEGRGQRTDLGSPRSMGGGSVTPGHEPPLRCPRHVHEPASGPCGPCGDARREHDAWTRRPPPPPTPEVRCPEHGTRHPEGSPCSGCVADARAAA